MSMLDKENKARYIWCVHVLLCVGGVVGGQRGRGWGFGGSYCVIG